LFVEKKIKLTEALCGATFTVNHLDGRILFISTKGEVLKPGLILQFQVIYLSNRRN
jgi:hypothetical protein